MELTGESLRSALLPISRAARAIPDVALLPGERMILAGRCFAEGDELVRRVVRALRKRPELFSDVPVDPDGLAARGRRARAFRQLASLLRHLLRRVEDCAIIDQAAAIDEALAVVEQARATAAQRFPHPRAAQRRAALRQAEELLAERQAHKRRTARRRAARPADPPRPAPQRRAVEEARRAAIAPVDRLPAPRPGKNLHASDNSLDVDGI